MFQVSMKTFAASTVVLVALAVSGCASPQPLGFVYFGASIPQTGASDVAATKSGSAQCTSILAMIAQGDCTIEAAKAAGGIKRVAYVDRKVDNILGIYGTYTTIVYGD